MKRRAQIGNRAMQKASLKPSRMRSSETAPGMSDKNAGISTAKGRLNVVSCKESAKEFENGLKFYDERAQEDIFIAVKYSPLRCGAIALRVFGVGSATSFVGEFINSSLWGYYNSELMN